ncbi:MAG TPA: hypothetical protein DCE41_01225 [Cytophagales bacterium]|nr:hypothetical protein [Cytophagales bacterium]HAA18241.1 hypothetical protein [Cytophagales bacterium]HAP59724.1 hypothetical protein [Cytophagales bacterium]
MSTHITNKQFASTIRKELKRFGEEENYLAYFPMWAMEILFWKLSKLEIKSMIVDMWGSGLDLDAMYVDEESRDIYFIKCRGDVHSNKGLDNEPCNPEWLRRLLNIPNRLNSVNKNDNSALRNIANDYKKYKRRGYTEQFYFLHLGHIEKDTIPNNFSEKETENLNYFGTHQIQQQYEEFQSREAPLPPGEVEVKITFQEDNNFISSKIGSHFTLISLITGSEIVRMREKHQFRLFDKNIRFNLGTTPINKAIIRSALKQPPTQFYYFNNGLTITTPNFKARDNGSIRIANPQIINGAQTVNSIFEAFKKRVRLNQQNRRLDEGEARDEAFKDFDKLLVLFRIIQTGTKANDKNFEMQVIRFNNTQNTVLTTDFFSNNEEQIKLQKELSNLGYFYEIKRGERLSMQDTPHPMLGKTTGEFKNQHDIFTMSRLAKAYRAFNLEPSQQQLNPGKIFAENSDDYKSVFGFNLEDVNSKLAQDMILALNLMSILEQEESLVNEIRDNMQVWEETGEKFRTLKNRVDQSQLLDSRRKGKISDADSYHNNKKYLTDLSIFPPGKFFVLAIIRLVINQCQYRALLFEADRYQDQDWLRNSLIQPWMDKIITKVLLPTYDRVNKDQEISYSSFFMVAKYFDHIEETFKGLEEELYQDYEVLFPLNV